jgi:hypothetical protein
MQEDAHGKFAEACLKTLQFIQIASESHAWAEEPLQYAAANVLYHMMRASRDKQLQLAKVIGEIIWPRQEIFNRWLRFVWDEGNIPFREV